MLFQREQMGPVNLRAKIEEKEILIESLWEILDSDDNIDMYEANLMRRLSGLLYLDKKIVGDIKEKVKNKK